MCSKISGVTTRKTAAALLFAACCAYIWHVVLSVFYNDPVRPQTLVFADHTINVIVLARVVSNNAVLVCVTRDTT